MRRVDDSLINNLHVLLDIPGVHSVTKHDVGGIDRSHIANRQGHRLDQLIEFRTSPYVDALKVPLVWNNSKERIFNDGAHIRMDPQSVCTTAPIGCWFGTPGATLAAESISVFVSASTNFLTPCGLKQHFSTLFVILRTNDVGIHQIQFRGCSEELKPMTIEGRWWIELAPIDYVYPLRYTEGP